MTVKTPVDTRGWFKRNARWLWTIVGLTLLLSVALCGIGFSLLYGRLKGMDSEPTHMKPSEVSAFEARYRDKETVQQAVVDLEKIIATIANSLTQAVPGLTWKWHREQGNVGCLQDPSADTAATRFVTRTVLFSGPIPEEKWPQAVEIVREEAEKLGMQSTFTYQERQEQHDLVFISDDEGEIRIGSAVKATISGKTPCRLLERWFSSHNVPLPEHR